MTASREQDRTRAPGRDGPEDRDTESGRGGREDPPGQMPRQDPGAGPDRQPDTR